MFDYNKYIGQSYGLLTIIEIFIQHKNRMVKAKCICGNPKITRLSSVVNGYTKSCGCLCRNNKNATTHGMDRTPTYISWNAMLNRCTNINADNYKYYGGRGITVCERWMKFENFYEDMGERPPNKTLDRINNDGDYELVNCRWSYSLNQALNRRPREALRV